MSKYDFELDLSIHSSTGLILSKIDSSSVVLEFGCATGRMTRYMKENMDCQVYIVEYDKGAYEKASKYAVDGLCDDILNFQWFEKFKGIEFDAIIFADVLEHLAEPEKVLEYSAKLLKETGAIYASIPNITHNDILLKLYEDHFDYTSTGLLDDTHIHFWGLKNIEGLAGKYGLGISNIEGTYCTTGSSEQFDEMNGNGSVLLANVLRERQCGEVYQFIVTFDKSGRSCNTHSFMAPSVKSHIYLDTGNGFNVDEILEFNSEYTGSGSFSTHYVIKKPEKIKRLRFDPLEGQGCILRKLSITQGNKSLPLNYLNSYNIDQGALLPGEDPKVSVEVLSNTEPIVVDAEFVIRGETYINMVEDAYLKKSAAFFALETENKALHRDMEMYRKLADDKDKHTIALEQELDQYKNMKIVKMYSRVRCLLKR